MPHGARDLGDFLNDIGNAVGLGNKDEEDKPEKREGSTRVVYVTQSPTFDGGIAGYYTSTSTSVKAKSTPSILQAPSTTQKPKSTQAPKPTSTKAKASETALSGLPESIVPSSTFDTSNSEVLLASQTEMPSLTPTEESVIPSSPPSSIPDTPAQSGMTAGAKAGLAIGIVAVIAAILSLIFFCLRQRKKAEERERMDDEKFTNVPPPAAAAAGGPASMRGLKRLSSAPRLDVRPTTAFFMPNRASQMQQNGAAGNGIQMTSQNRGMEQNRANPFGNHAESIDPVNGAGPSLVDGAAMAGAAAGARGPVRSTSRGAQNKYNGNKSAQSPFSDAARTDGGRGAQMAGQNMHNTGVMPQPLAGVIEEGGPISPGSPPLAAAGLVGAGAVTSGAASDTQLYRVHLDFSPSMPDELRVRAGEIVKLLKEFDDGWCMCIKEDGSSEGVLPRTCISNSPIAGRSGARRTNSNKSIPGPFQNNQRRHSPPSGSNGNAAPLPQQGPGQGRPQQGRPQGPMSPGMNGNNGRNSPGPGNYNQGQGPQYRPQQQGGPPMNRGPGPQQPQVQQPQQAQQQQQTPSSPPPHAIASPSSPTSTAAVAGSFSPAAVPLSSSPALSQGSGGFSIPEVTITAPSGPAPPSSPPGSVVGRKPVGRKPVGGGAQ
ncbi:hypothetical protein VE02_08658 [Pseudogymnoascus sp. 03VT05]|nr:hypothetical protein VE02_08658 [Pseudogymnoascus sp. 03VT05]